MRVTKEILLKIAENSVQERVEIELDLNAAYLTGSLINDDPFLGGTADIDLVFIHEAMPEEREIVRVTEDVHLDIQHYPRSKFEPARDLRSDPWLGTSLFNAKPIYDPQHHIDFIQASVRGMFLQPENILARAEPFLDNARKTWISFHNSSKTFDLKETKTFLKALENIVNAISSLTEGPLTNRRFLLDYQARSKALGKPGLYAGILGLLGVNNISQEEIASWVPRWEQAYDNVSALQSSPENIHPHRKAYHLKAIQYFLAQEDFKLAAWPLLNNWAELASKLHPGDPLSEKWQDITKKLNLSGEGFTSRLEGLDAYLDMAEEIFENWKEKQGLL